MLATHTQRTRPYSVHLTRAEAWGLAIAAEVAAAELDDVPELAELGGKLSALLDDPALKRA